MSTSSSAAAAIAAPQPSQIPTLVFTHGEERRSIPLDKTPFTIGRRPDRDLVVTDPRVSREHAQIVQENAEFFVVDLGSKHGCYVNGEKITRHALKNGDRVEIGVPGLELQFQLGSQPSAAREFLSQIAVKAVPGASNDIEKLTMFLEAARKLNTANVVEEILVTLIETTLRLTRAERGYVFLRQPDGSLKLAAARTHKGQPLVSDKTISHSILEEAANSASEFLVTDTMKSSKISARESIIANDLRTVICIPLRRRRMQQAGNDDAARQTEVTGVLYLDSRLASAEFSSVGQDILGAIATETAALLENASLVQAEENAKRYQQELSIAASIQQRLMAVTIPDVPFARLRARNVPCKDVGGDFFDVVPTEEGLTVCITDVSGKGISAALLASVLQGMIYSQLIAGVRLADIATAANRFLCQKVSGEKYATMVLATLRKDGSIELVNCGHVQPVVCGNSGVWRVEQGDLPIGLLPMAQYSPILLKLKPGERVLLVTDGVTEAEDAAGDFFGEERLEGAVACDSPYDKILEAVRTFCGETPAVDDCTVVELQYLGNDEDATRA